jgi:hypothetical protein
MRNEVEFAAWHSVFNLLLAYAREQEQTKTHETSADPDCLSLIRRLVRSSNNRNLKFSDGKQQLLTECGSFAG